MAPSSWSLRPGRQLMWGPGTMQLPSTGCPAAGTLSSLHSFALTQQWVSARMQAPANGPHILHGHGALEAALAVPRSSHATTA